MHGSIIVLVLSHQLIIPIRNIAKCSSLHVHRRVVICSDVIVSLSTVVLNSRD